ncbi:MAG: glycosyltransferase [Candidatus Heimdallarchaeaceae archaeon]
MYKSRTSKKSICFVADEKGWAFDKITRGYVDNLKTLGVEAKQYYRNTIPLIIREEYIYVCWWPDTNIVKNKICNEQKILCKISDMVTWNSNAPKDWQKKFLEIVPYVFKFVSASQEIDTTLKSMGIQNSIIVGDGVNTDTFREKNYVLNKKPRLGWCGNPRALEWMGFRDIKGLTILKELKKLDEINFIMATNKPAFEMPEWYKNIDIYVCSSRFEGTPLPILEAMAVGNIIISTSVGIVKEINSPGLFLFDGTLSDLKKKLDEVLNRKEEWAKLGHLNRKYIINNRSEKIMAIKLYSELFKD